MLYPLKAQPIGRRR